MIGLVRVGKQWRFFSCVPLFHERKGRGTGRWQVKVSRVTWEPEAAAEAWVVAVVLADDLVVKSGQK